MVMMKIVKERRSSPGTHENEIWYKGEERG